MKTYLTRKHASLLSPRFLILMGAVFFTIVFITQHWQTHASGNIVFATPGDNLQSKASSLQPGDTLILNDGTYSNAHLLINGVHGTVTSPITIKAAHDGKAVLDGGGNTGNQGVIEVTNSSYIEIDGLVAQHGGQDVVGAYNTVDHITFRRITAHDAGPGNYHVFDMAYTGVTDILVEDCAGWGNGRYIFVAYHAANVTFRRTWARWTSQTNWSPAPRACYGVYNTSNESLENAICIHDIPDMNSPEYFTSTWQNGNDNTKYLGVMFYNNWDGVYVNSGAGQNTQVVNSYFANTRQQGTFTDSQNHGDAIYWLPTNTTGVVSNSTFVNNETGFNQHHGTTAVNNSVFLNNDTATTGVSNHSNLDFFGNKSIGLIPSSTDKQIDPGYDINKYGQGAYLFVSPSSVLKHAGTNGSDIGANIIYEYVNGQLTNTPLWPWPMEDRIKAENGTSVTWTTGGGFWKTLDGVYANGTPVSPSVTPVPTASSGSPQPTSPAGSTAFSLTVCPHGLGKCGDNVNSGSGGNTNLKHTTRNVTLSFLNGQNQPVGSGHGTITYQSSSGDFQGIISPGQLQTGQYLVKVQLDGFLPKQLPGIVSVTGGTQITLPPISLVTGDINNDGQIDILDYNILVGCFGSKQNSSSCTMPPTTQASGADINDDGVVDGVDYNLFIREISVQKGN